MAPPLPIIHINGFPGTGKLTIAKHLTKLLSPIPAKLVHNHLLINPADAILHRTQPGYQTLRRAIRSAIFSSLINERATYTSAYIFTDFQTTDEVGSAVCAEFKNMSEARGGKFIPVVLACDEDENLRRLVAEDRKIHLKLVDSELVRKFRSGAGVHRFVGYENALELDVSHMSAEDAAQSLFQHILKICPELRDVENSDQSGSVE